jgi:hypothetical protein
VCVCVRDKEPWEKECPVSVCQRVTYRKGAPCVCVCVCVYVCVCMCVCVRARVAPNCYILNISKLLYFDWNAL